MRVNISCLLAFVLGCHVTAEIIHEVVEEKKSVTLRCPRPVRGDVKWSRETNGHKVDILTATGDRDIRHNDPGRRYSSQLDKSFYIGSVTVSDSGIYLCNDEPAADLTVIPPGTLRLHVAERTSITLKCPSDDGGSDVPTWSRDDGDIEQSERFIVSSVDKTLTIKRLNSGDSGLYYCEGKPAAYLTVTKDETSDGERKTMTTTTTTTTTVLPSAAAAAADSHLWMFVRTVTGILYLIIMISITVTIWRKTQQKQKQKSDPQQEVSG